MWLASDGCLDANVNVMDLCNFCAEHHRKVVACGKMVNVKEVTTTAAAVAAEVCGGSVESNSPKRVRMRKMSRAKEMLANVAAPDDESGSPKKRCVICRQINCGSSIDCNSINIITSSTNIASGMSKVDDDQSPPQRKAFVCHHSTSAGGSAKMYTNDKNSKGRSEKQTRQMASEAVDDDDGRRGRHRGTRDAITNMWHLWPLPVWLSKLTAIGRGGVTKQRRRGGSPHSLTSSSVKCHVAWAAWVLLRLLLYVAAGVFVFNCAIVLPMGVAGNEIRADRNMSRPETGVCQSIDIRNSPTQLANLSNCRVIEGFLQILLIDQNTENSYENYSFPLLTEITDFLLVFRVNGLRSLGKLFPNLAVIRGNSLFNNYALVIYEVFQLEEIALKSLMYIGRGAVRIEKNPLLCYVDSIDWTAIATVARRTEDHVFLFNKNENECPLCPGGNNTEATNGSVALNCPPTTMYHKKKYHCWNLNHCQRICPKQCERNCDEYGNCCDESCIGGCQGSPKNCTVCRHFSLGDRRDRQCISKCPNKYYAHMGRRCISEQECLRIPKPLEGNSEMAALPYIPFQDQCRVSCPQGYELNAQLRTCTPCLNGACKKICNGAKIDSIGAAQKMENCNIIKGSIEIQIRREGLNIVSEVESFLSQIEEIHGALKIARSDPFISLNFFKSLRVIHGVNNSDSFILLDNENLQELWGENQTVRILTGRLMFHNNPKLCLQKIEKLQPMLAPGIPFVLEEFAKNSNGDRTACNVTRLDVRISTIFEKGAHITWDSVNMEDPRSLIGYVIYHRVAPYQNVSLLEGRDACGFDGWQDDDVPASTFPYFIFTHLEPYTQYAFYVKTYQIVAVNTGAQSDILYFTTKPSEPETVRNLRVRSNGSYDLILDWDPPRKANGNLTVYIIKCNITTDNYDLLKHRDFCNERLVPTEATTKPTPAPEKPIIPLDPAQCNCAKTKPSEDDVLNQITFEDQLHNYVYVKRMPSSSTRRRRDIEFVRGSENSTNQTPILFPAAEAPLEAPITPKHNIRNGTYFTYIYREVTVPTTTVVLSELKHYTMYSISVVACRSGPQANNCSTEVIVNHRTLPLPGADDIKDVTILKDSNDSNVVSLTWKPPENPNSLIVSYSIVYQNKDVEHSSTQPTCIKATDFHALNNKFFLKLGADSGNYSIEVAATSLYGTGNFTVPVFYKKEAPSNTVQIVVIVLSFLVIFATVVGGTWYVMNKKQQRQRNLRLIASVNPDYETMVYEPDEYEIPRERVKQLKELGQGSFGMVYEGLVRIKESDTDHVPCAIKTVNENCTDRERQSFLQEASVMKSFHTHHVVRLLGVVSRGDPPLVVMELMALGDLKKYLRLHRPDAEPTENGEVPQPPTLKRILQMAVEIADGMSYLAHKKFVHRDLAARNCMVAEDLTVKIGDFGMTRDIYETDYYRKGDKGLLPVRWMSPESLKDGVFTSSSDVFSYGVVLWEISTLASQPYQGLSNDQVLRYVIDGGVMERPENCPDKLYKMMRDCWEHRPSNRPTFIDIVTSLLSDDISQTFYRNSFYFSDDGENYRILLQSNENHFADDGTTLLRNAENIDMSPEDHREAVNYYTDRPNNNNNNNRRLVEDAGPMPIIKPAQSPLRYLTGRNGNQDDEYRESKF